MPGCLHGPWNLLYELCPQHFTATLPEVSIGWPATPEQGIVYPCVSYVMQGSASSASFHHESQSEETIVQRPSLALAQGNSWSRQKQYTNSALIALSSSFRMFQVGCIPIKLDGQNSKRSGLGVEHKWNKWRLRHRQSSFSPEPSVAWWY